jgi:hypothetical protein
METVRDIRATREPGPQIESLSGQPSRNSLLSRTVNRLEPVVNDFHDRPLLLPLPCHREARG